MTCDAKERPLDAAPDCPPLGPERVTLGLGANLGDPRGQLRAGAEALASSGALLRLTGWSSFYRSAALLPEGAPEDWNLDYVNAVCIGETLLSPLALLEAVKRAEKEAGRRERGRWAPRELDIDILTYGERRISSVALTLPHPLMLTRSFVTVPLAEVAPESRYPGDGEHAGRTYAEIASLMPKDPGLLRLPA